MSIDNTSPTRDISHYAESEDLPPQNLFDSIQEYRTFVKRWRALYKEVSLRRRAHGAAARFQRSQYDVEMALKAGRKASSRPSLVEAAEKAKLILGEPQSVDLKATILARVPKWVLDVKGAEICENGIRKKVSSEEYVAWTVSHGDFYVDPTMLISIRIAGKRWVKHYHPWKAPAAAA